MRDISKLLSRYGPGVHVDAAVRHVKVLFAPVAARKIDPLHGFA